MKRLVLACIALAAVVSGCTSGSSGGKVVTVTVPPSTPPAATGSTAGNLSGSNTATPSSSPTAVATRLPGNCGDLLGEFYVTQALGGQQLGGTTAFVVGTPDATIGRQSTINCRYGVSGDTQKVEIGVSLYATAAQASARITATGSEYTANGATSKDVTVEGGTGVYLSGGRGTAYASPVLAVASGRRTVAVTITGITSPPAEQAAIAVAKTALERTAG